jgi:DivIVA domain-containing protein
VPQAMMWVFAVLIVLAMGGIAMLAAGRGEPMKPAYDDRPDALVPLDRTITSDDLRNVRFSLAFRGYRMSEVDALLARLALEQDLRAAPPAEPGSSTTPVDAEDSGRHRAFPVAPPPPPPE